MEYKLTNKQLSNSFNSLMKEYSELQMSEKSYDWYEHEKGRYIDLNVFNFYEDVELDWEDDTWILQYQPEKGDIDPDLEVPILRYDEYVLRNTLQIFGKEMFEELLKEWFNNNYQIGYDNPVKSVSTEHF
jgi:hypothetical protein